MNIEVHYRPNKIDGQHEYSIVVPFRKDAPYPPYWNFWVWFYLGSLMKGDNSIPHIIPYANSWDENSKLIKVYKDTSDARKCATRIFNFIQKHYTKKKK